MIPSVPELSVLRAVVAICVGFLLGCSQSATLPDTQPSVATVAGEFKGYRRMTAGLVFVNPEFMVQCAPVSKEQVEAARKKSGPHANTRIEIYMNELAAKAFLAKTNSFPAGAVIVKAKQMRGDVVGNEQAVSDGVGGMIKRPAGYDPEYGDWEYFYFEDLSKIESGKIASCMQCHSSAKAKDYVFGTWAERVTAEAPGRP
jgi:hypothetical protein